MPLQITRRLKPEDEEILRKREELAAVRATLAERELELVDLRKQLAAFEGRYLRRVGTLYAELDEWKARISELHARLNPSAASQAQAEEAREQARHTYEDAHGKASETPDFTPSPDLKRLFREVAKRIHPDFSKDSIDLERRTRFMAEANRAYEAGDAEALQRILDEYRRFVVERCWKKERRFRAVDHQRKHRIDKGQWLLDLVGDLMTSLIDCDVPLAEAVRWLGLISTEPG
jgi:hypothetical protein